MTAQSYSQSSFLVYVLHYLSFGPLSLLMCGGWRKGNGGRDGRKRNEGKDRSLCGEGGVEGRKREGSLGKGHAVTLIRKG